MSYKLRQEKNRILRRQNEAHHSGTTNTIFYMAHSPTKSGAETSALQSKQNGSHSNVVTAFECSAQTTHLPSVQKQNQPQTDIQHPFIFPDQNTLQTSGLTSKANSSTGKRKMTSEASKVLILGPQSSGKTTLISRFQLLLKTERDNRWAKGGAEVPLPPPTTPTIGSEVHSLQVGGKVDGQGQGRRLWVREVGGKGGGSFFEQFVQSCVDVVVYVMDIGNRCQLALSISHIKALLDHPQLQDTSFAFVLNKRDCASAMSGSCFENTCGLQKLLLHYPNPCIIIETSCRSMENVHKLLTWVSSQACNEHQ